jgi:hypothetical protein
MDTECGHCRESVFDINILMENKGMPPFIGLCTNGEEKRSAFFDEFQPDFPLGQISKDDFWRLLGDGDIPCFIFLRDGRVEKVWNGKVPDPESIPKRKT